MKIKVQCDGCDKVEDARVSQERCPNGGLSVSLPEGWVEITLSAVRTGGMVQTKNYVICAACERDFWRGADPRQWPRKGGG